MALNINFLTIDPANHFRAAMDLVETGTVTSMFYETVLNGLLFEFLAPFAPVDYFYRFLACNRSWFNSLSLCIRTMWYV